MEGAITAGDDAMPPLLLPGLPDHLATLCLARVPSSACLWRVCTSWRNLLYLPPFQSLRTSHGFPPFLWLYVFLRSPSPSPSFAWHAFDPLSRFWHPLPPLPDPIEFHLSSPSVIGFSHSIQCVSVTNKLIMVAGVRRSKDRPRLGRPQLEPALECPLLFDTRMRSWRSGSPFREPRKWCACGSAFEKLYIGSGCGKDWEFGLAKAFDVYDPETDEFHPLESFKSSKFSGEAINAVNHEESLYMVSGRGVFWKVGAIYDAKTGKWTDMPRGMMTGWTGSCVVTDGRFFVLEENIGRLKIYDPTEDRWMIFMENDLLKHVEQLVGAPGKICGVVAAGHSDSGQDVIRIVHVRGTPNVIDLRPPYGQVVALQVLSSMNISDETS